MSQKAPAPLNEPLPLTRPGFPVLTLIGTIGLIILAAVTLLRNCYHDADSAPTSSLKNEPAHVIAEQTPNPSVPPSTTALR